MYLFAKRRSKQNTAIERYETKKLNTSTLDEIVNERYRHDGFFVNILITLTISLTFSLRVAKRLFYMAQCG